METREKGVSVSETSHAVLQLVLRLARCLKT